jgi:hypothetical protein
LDAARHIVAEQAADAATHGRVSGRSFRLTLYAVVDNETGVPLTATR